MGENVGSDDGKGKNREWVRYIIPSLLLAGVYAVALRILFVDIDVSSPGEKSNHALVQLVQWTISTVLAFGGALVGLNWYQNESRYQQDKKDMKNITDELTTRVQELEYPEGGLSKRIQTLESRNFALDGAWSADITDLRAALEQSLMTHSERIDRVEANTRDYSQVLFLTPSEVHALIKSVKGFTNYHVRMLQEEGSHNKFTEAFYNFTDDHEYRLSSPEAQPALLRLLQVADTLEEGGHTNEAQFIRARTDRYKPRIMSN